MVEGLPHSIAYDGLIGEQYSLPPSFPAQWDCRCGAARSGAAHGEFEDKGRLVLFGKTFCQRLQVMFIWLVPAD